MADFPTSIFEPREVENVPGESYEPSETTRVFAEDVNFATSEIVAIEEVLGTEPNGSFDTVKEWLEDLASSITSLFSLIFIDSTNDRVGIDTTSPTQKLDVRGRITGGTQVSQIGWSVDFSREDWGHVTEFADSGSGHRFRIQNESQGLWGDNGELFQIFPGSSGQAAIVEAWASSALFVGTGGNSPLHLHTDRTKRISVLGDGKVGIGTDSPSVLFDVNSDIIRLRTSKTPSSASATGVAGSVCWDSSYIYICTATNTWKRVAISTW